MKNDKYCQDSIDLHLFYARIMKEHAYFLADAFRANEYIYKTFIGFQNRFDDFINEAIAVSKGAVSSSVFSSSEITTQYTIDCETRSVFYTNIPINTDTTFAQMQLNPDDQITYTPAEIRTTDDLNAEVLTAVRQFKEYKEAVLSDIKKCNVQFYPSFLIHFISETEMYEFLITNLENEIKDHKAIINFWNASINGHTAFIPSQLDISEKTVINQASKFQTAFGNLYRTGRTTPVDMKKLISDSLYYAAYFRNFQENQLTNILNCSLQVVALPLSGDHILRETNYFIRLLKSYAI